MHFIHCHSDSLELPVTDSLTIGVHTSGISAMPVMASQNGDLFRGSRHESEFFLVAVASAAMQLLLEWVTPAALVVAKLPEALGPLAAQAATLNDGNLRCLTSRPTLPADSADLKAWPNWNSC